jgi:hypothetical protein
MHARTLGRTFFYIGDVFGIHPIVNADIIARGEKINDAKIRQIAQSSGLVHDEIYRDLVAKLEGQRPYQCDMRGRACYNKSHNQTRLRVRVTWTERPFGKEQYSESAAETFMLDGKYI